MCMLENALLADVYGKCHRFSLGRKSKAHCPGSSGSFVLAIISQRFLGRDNAMVMLVK